MFGIFSKVGELIFCLMIALVLYKSGWQEDLFNNSTALFLLFLGFCIKMMGRLIDDMIVERKIAKEESERQDYIRSLYGKK
ncbi:MAG: hypothetical protein NTZ49_02095 [Candidatus Parcubacteria bacterium]|nr:hypothetical protein [Candidatus Parcubacteria bacterium]